MWVVTGVPRVLSESYSPTVLDSAADTVVTETAIHKYLMVDVNTHSHRLYRNLLSYRQSL